MSITAEQQQSGAIISNGEVDQIPAITRYRVHRDVQILICMRSP
jgi:hypothetical protein